MDFTPSKIGIPTRPYYGPPEFEEIKNMPNTQAHYSVNNNSHVHPPNQQFHSQFSGPQSGNIKNGGKIQVPAREYNPIIPNVAIDKNIGPNKIKDHFNGMRKKVNDNLKNSINLLIKQAEEELLSIDKLENIINEQMNLDSTLSATNLNSDLLKYKDFALNSVPRIESPASEISEPQKKNQSLASVPSPAKSQNDLHIKVMSVYNDTMAIYSTDLQTIVEVKLPGFVKGTDAILLGGDSIFYANHLGSYKINVATKNTTNYKGFSSKRTYFAMTTFNQKPIVIGGIINSRTTNTVEIFQNNSWVKFDSLRLPKSHPRAIQYQSCLYVFGGIDSGYSLDIEKYSGNWTILDVKMPIGMKDFGLCHKNNEIYIFGGKNKDGVYSKVHIFYPHDASFKLRAKHLDKGLSFVNNESAYQDGSNFYLLDKNERRIIVN